MKNSSFGKFLRRYNKSVISFILILAMIVTGVVWPDKNTKADIISDLDLKYISTDNSRPYSLLTAEIEGSLSNVNYFLYQSSHPLYFLSDQKTLGIRATDSDISGGNVTVTKYAYESGTRAWNLRETQTISNQTVVSNVGTGTKYGQITDTTSNFYSFGTIGGGYGVVGYIDNFGLSSYVPSSYGEYIIGYGGQTAVNAKEYTSSTGTVVEGQKIINKNFINYEKFNTSEVSLYPSLVASGMSIDDSDFSVSNFYKAVTLLNDDSGFGYFNNNFSYDELTLDSSGPIVDTLIGLPVYYTLYESGQSIPLAFYATQDTSNATHNAIPYAFDANGDITSTISRSESGNVITYSTPDGYKINLHLTDNLTKKIDSISFNVPSGFTTYDNNTTYLRTFVLKLPTVFINPEHPDIRVGRDLYVLIRTKPLAGGATDNSYQQALTAAKNDSNLSKSNRLMLYSDYLDYDFSKTYTVDTNGAYYVNDVFYNSDTISGGIFLKSANLKAFSSNTDFTTPSTSDGLTHIEIVNGTTSYRLYGQLTDYLPGDKSVGTRFSLSLISGESSNDNLYVSSDGTSIYYSESATSAERLELVRIDYGSQYSTLRLNADNITYYRVLSQNTSAFSKFGITGQIASNGSTAVNSFTVNLEGNLRNNGTESFVEMNLDSSYSSMILDNWEPISVETLTTTLPIEGRYPELPTSINGVAGPYATLINYGEYQLLVYTSSKPIYSSGELRFKDEAVDMEFYRYTSGEWSYENYISKVTDASLILPLRANTSSIDFINYDLVSIGSNNGETTILKANDYYDDGAPKLRTYSIPSLTNVVGSDLNQYIFLKNAIGYYAFVSSDKITVDGTDIIYPSSGSWYTLIQNTWKEISEDVALDSNYMASGRQEFETYLKYTNDGNSAWTNATPWADATWGNVDYFRYIPIYTATMGYNYIIYETANGFQSLEYDPSVTGGITITKDGIKFANRVVNSGVLNRVVVKTYSTNSWITEPNSSAINYFSNDGYYFRSPDVLNSIVYSNVDIKDEDGKTLISNSFSQSLIVSDALSSADIGASKPVTTNNDIVINGVSYPYVILTQEEIDGNLTYVTYISNQPFKYSTSIGSSGDGNYFDIVANEYPLTVYKEVWDMSSNSWGTPELMASVSEEYGTVSSLVKSYSETSNGVVTYYYNQFPNGRVVRFNSSFTVQEEGHFVSSVFSTMGDLPDNATEIYYDSEGKEYQGTWQWKWSDNGSLVDYYYTADGTRVTDTTRSHKYYRSAKFIAGGSASEYASASGQYINYYGQVEDMGSKDLLGNWWRNDGVVVTPAGDYGYYDDSLNIVSTRTSGIAYYADKDETGAIVAAQMNVSDEGDDELTSRIIGICRADNIKWINNDVEAVEDATLSASTYESVTFSDSSVEAILGSFINPESITNKLEYLEPRTSVTNYWISFFDSCSSIYNPFLSGNGLQGKVAKELLEYRLYFPNYGNIVPVVTGAISEGGVAFDLTSFSSTSIYKSNTDWYQEAELGNDVIAPIINAVYMVNHTFKIDAVDPGAYETVFDNEGNRIYTEHTFNNVNVIYRKVPLADYSSATNKNDSDADGIPFYKTTGNGTYFELLSNNNAIIENITLNGNSYQVLYVESPDTTFENTTASVSEYTSSGVDTGNVYSIPRMIERDGIVYSLVDNLDIVNNVLYREVNTTNADLRMTVSAKEPVKNTFDSSGNQLTGTFTIFFKGRVTDSFSLEEQAAHIPVDTNHGTLTGSNGKYYYSYTTEDGEVIADRLELVFGQEYRFSFTENGVNKTWGIKYDTPLTTKSGSSNNPAGENETYERVYVTEYEDVRATKTLVESSYITDSVSFTRLVKKLTSSDITHLEEETGTPWATLLATKDNKGIYNYQNTSNSIWNGSNIEMQSGKTIGDDGYIYSNGNRVAAAVSYDEDGNQVVFDVTGIEKYYITIEEDFVTDIEFSYDDGNGNVYSFAPGQVVSKTIPETGAQRVIPLPDNEFLFPVDINSGQLKINAYVVDGAGNKSTSITGPWTLTRNNLGTTKNWEQFFVDGYASDAIKAEIEAAIFANTSDTKIPEITGIFLYKGQLYIIAVDNDDEETGAKASGIGLAGTYNYLYEYVSFDDEDATTTKALSYYTMANTLTTLNTGTTLGRRLTDADYDKDGELLEASHKYLDTVANMSLGQQNGYMEVIKNTDGTIRDSKVEVSVFDVARNQSNRITVDISEDKNNSVLYGSVSQTIYEMLLAARDASGQTDKIAPIITSLYTLNGILYVEAQDNLGITSYGYKWLNDTASSGTTTGTDDNGQNITFENGETISKGTTVWHGAAQQAINVPTRMTVYVVDEAGNSASETIIITSDSQLLYGTPTNPDAVAEFGDDPAKEGNSAPIIENVYTYRGHLYVEGYDPDGNLRTWGYGFNPLDNMSITTSYEGYNANGTWVSIPAGQTIRGNQLVYKNIGVQEINIPLNITISMIDTLGAETEETYYIFKDNYVYKGAAPDNISGEVEDPDPSDNPTPAPGGDVTPTPGPGEGDVTPTPVDPTKPIPVPSDIPSDIDWDEYDYLFEILDYNTGRTVYSIRLDSSSAIDCPRLENSVLYKYRISLLKEGTDTVTNILQNGTIRMTDTIPPTITKIWYSKNRIYVSAYDLGGFDSTPYSFTIEGSRNTKDNYISNNNTVVLSGETINVKVKDAAGNISTAQVKIHSDVNTNNVLYESLNPKGYLYVNSSDMKSLAYWYAYINTTYGLDVSDTYLSDINKSDNVSFEIKNNNVYLNVNGDGVISFYDNKTKKYLAINLRTLNTGKSYRSIVVQTGSDLDVSLAFKNKLTEQFGTIDGLTWYADGDILTRTGSMVSANRPGIGTVKFVKDGKELNVYVLVVDSISGTKTSLDLSKENFAYTYRLKDIVNLETALRTDSDEISRVVIDNVSDGVETSTRGQLSFTSSGVKEIDVINCVDDELGNIKFEVISITPYISTFTDIIGSDARSNIETLCEKGIIGNYLDNKYKPVNKMTTKEFLTMLNRIRLIYDSDFVIDKIVTTLNLSEKDYDYYSSQNILINMSQAEVDSTISTYTLNKAITFEEVVKLISATILYDKYHNESGLSAPAGLSNCAQEAIHLISMGIIDADDTRNGTRELTRAEISYMLIKTIKYLEL